MLETKHSGNHYDMVQFVDSLVLQAIKMGASDVHIESVAQGMRIRYRIDGILYDQMMISKEHGSQILARIKIMAHINIAEKRIPQDGKFRLHADDQVIDLRVSCFPSIYGEKIVIRILDRSRQALNLERLGFSVHTLAAIRELIRKSHGFFLVTGPTGSGKTTTLYAILSALNDPTKHIITLEDPVEYNVDGITQGQIHPDVGFSFEQGIRALLRQDPDIAMIGEIRDKQSARIAVEAALTGHLVLSTLHTNDAPSALMRLMDMGIEPFLINASITGILAQRLVRLICPSCKIESEPSADEQHIIAQRQLPITRVWKGVGCDQCFRLGYKGRIGIFELLLMNNELRSLVVQHPIVEDIYAQALEDGMQTLLNDGVNKVNEGSISLQELMRVVY